MVILKADVDCSCAPGVGSHCATASGWRGLVFCRSSGSVGDKTLEISAETEMIHCFDCSVVIDCLNNYQRRHWSRRNIKRYSVTYRCTFVGACGLTGTNPRTNNGHKSMTDRIP